MGTAAELHYLFKPDGTAAPQSHVAWLSVQQFLADEPACKKLWELLDAQFRTRSKFLAIWPSVRFLAVHRDAEGSLDGAVLVSTPVNWQIDYVVVRPESRGQGIAAMMVKAALYEAQVASAPYVMLSSNPSLRTLYEGCGFRVVWPFPIESQSA